MLLLIRKVVFSLLFLLVCIELILRFGYGFCNAPLYIKDADYEYIYAPNQRVKRFGNIIRTNAFSMRSEELSETDSTIVLLIGDSVVNGGSLTDNDDLASTLLEKQLSDTLRKPVRVLNISAGSWGPDNAAAYLRKHGIFGAKLICLVVSSHDAFDNMTHHDQVGIDPNLPDRQYKIALVELWKRYIYPLYIRDLKFNNTYYAPLNDTISPDSLEVPIGIWKGHPDFNPGFAELDQIARENEVPLLIYLHPETFEIEDGDYNEQGQLIIEFAENHGIRLIKEIEMNPLKEYYRERDIVHFNPQGQKFLAGNLFPLILEYLNGPK